MLFRSLHWAYFYGQFDTWFSYYDCMTRLGIEPAKRFQPFFDLADSCGYIWAYWDIAIFTERMSACHLDPDGRLHCENGPAVAYPDGTGVYVWHGVRVPAPVIKGNISITMIDTEQNVEIRRVMLERYGYAKYLQDSGTREIQRDEFGVLYKKNIPDDEPLVMVRVINTTPESDGSHKEYFLRVPPDTTTAAQGVA